MYRVFLCCFFIHCFCYFLKLIFPEVSFFCENLHFFEFFSYIAITRISCIDLVRDIRNCFTSCEFNSNHLTEKCRSSTKFIRIKASIEVIGSFSVFFWYLCIDILQSWNQWSESESHKEICLAQKRLYSMYWDSLHRGDSHIGWKVDSSCVGSVFCKTTFFYRYGTPHSIPNIIIRIVFYEIERSSWRQVCKISLHLCYRIFWKYKSSNMFILFEFLRSKILVNNLVGFSNIRKSFLEFWIWFCKFLMCNDTLAIEANLSFGSL